MFDPPWLACTRREIAARKKVRPQSIKALVFSLSLDFSVSSVFSVVQDRFGFRPDDGPVGAMYRALHSPCQRTKLPDTTYGAYALKPYNI